MSCGGRWHSCARSGRSTTIGRRRSAKASRDVKGEHENTKPRRTFFSCVRRCDLFFFVFACLRVRLSSCRVFVFALLLGEPPMTDADSIQLFDSGDPSIYDLVSAQPGPPGQLPIEPRDLLHRPSGDVFGWTQDVGMGWQPADLRRPEMLILSTQGGIREPDGTPLALGYHTGHWEVGLLMRAAAEELRRHHCIPFAGFCTDPCDGRTQGTTGMMDSLPFRNDAAVVLRRLIRSLPTRAGVLGIATCDKGLPAMMMALAGVRDVPSVLVPGGVTLPASDGVDA